MPARPASKPRRKPPQFRLESHIFYLLSRILASRNRALNAKLGAHGVDYPRWRVLGVLSEHPGASMLQLAELTAVDRTTLTHTVRMMVGEGLIRRRQRGTDRRSVALDLTRRGKAIFTQVLPAVLEQNEQALIGFAADEIATLRLLLRRVVANLMD